MDNRLISLTLACAALLLVMAATAASAQSQRKEGTFCMNELSDDDRKNNRTPIYAKYTLTELKNHFLTQCKDPNDKCIECLPVRNEIQGYVSFCSSTVQHTDARYSCGTQLLEPCTREKRPCAVALHKLYKRETCPYFYKVQGSVKYDEQVICTGFCAVGVVYIDRQYHVSAGCNKQITEWLTNFKTKHSEIVSRHCPNVTREEDCMMPVRFLINRNGTNDTDTAATGTASSVVQAATTIDKSPTTEVVVSNGQVVVGGGGDTSSTSVVDAPTPPPARPIAKSTPKPAASSGKGAEGTARASAALAAAAAILAALPALRPLRLA